MFERASTLRPEDFQAPVLLAQAYDSLGDAANAESWYRRGVQILGERMELNPDEPIVLTMYALYHSTCGRYDEALALARRACKLDPLSPFVGMGVGWAHHFAGQHEAVVREMTELLTVHPGVAEAGNLLFAALSDLGRHEEALAIVEKQRLWQLPFDAEALRKALRSGCATAMPRNG